jgi:cell division protein ZapB
MHNLHMATIIMTDEKFTTLDQKIDSLIELCATMKRENQLLRANEHNWHSERQQLLETNKLAKTRLESVLNRLKSLEQSQSS